MSRQSLRHVTAAEWVKFRTVRSTLWALAITVVLSIGIGALISWVQRHDWGDATFADRALFDPVNISLAGFSLAEIAVGVIGVLVISSEYTSGSIRTTLAATPRRPLVLLAKSLVLFAAILVVGEVCAFVSFELGQAIMSGVTPTASLSSPGALQACLLAGLSLSLLATFALGIGAIVRHTAGAITLFVAVVLVVPIIVLVLPSSWNTHIFKWLPEMLAGSMRAARPQDPQLGTLFSPLVSAAVLAGYALASLALGAVLLVRRDA